MSCLIYASNSDGCIGKCDANCYNAQSPQCDCICRGMNHGKGLSAARDNTAKYADEWIKQYKQEKGKNVSCQVNGEVYQLEMF